MAAHHHSSVFTCGHCGSEFSGRKRKFCTAKCQQEAAYQRKVDRGIKRSTGKKRRPPHPIIDGKRVCLDCERNLPISEFPECRHAKSGYRGLCKPCFAAFNRRRKKPDPNRNTKLEAIRTQTNKGRCGPPTRKQHESLVRKYERHHAKGAKRLEREAMAAWHNWLYRDAPSEWCNRYWGALGEPWRSRGYTEAQRYRLRYQGDSAFNMAERMRRQINKAMKRDHVAELIRGAIKRGGESPTVERLLGYTISDLMDHIERQFTKGMTWDRMMAGEIHIDHITPQAAGSSPRLRGPD